MCPYKYAKNGAKVPYTPPAGGQCKLVSVEGLFRHGTRQPTTKYMGKISGTLEPILEKYRVVLKLQWMKEWDSPYVPSVGGLLSPLGVTEAYDVGSRITKYFKSAFIPYNPNEVIITPSGVSNKQTNTNYSIHHLKLSQMCIYTVLFNFFSVLEQARRQQSLGGRCLEETTLCHSLLSATQWITTTSFTFTTTANGG